MARDARRAARERAIPGVVYRKDTQKTLESKPIVALEEQQAQARERWREYQRTRQRLQEPKDRQSQDAEKTSDLACEHGGMEDDFGL